MIGYITLGTNDLAKSAKFYDELLAEIGAKRFFEMDTFIAWGTSKDKCCLSVSKPYDGNSATVGNGVMAAISADSKNQVDILYKKAIELGAKDEGAPGSRGENFYAAYFRDPDGNKLNAYFMG